MNKTLAIFLGLAAVGGLAVAQDAPVYPAPGPAVVGQAGTVVYYDEAQLDQLLGPIALYPDALIALILPASTASTDIVLAARTLRDNPGLDPTQIENSPWDDSVKSLAHYPDVLKWMDENLMWTQQLGQAFTAQPADVMNTVQRLRARARAAGTLVDTPQQQVIAEGGTISIVPAQPDVIYVPYYDPAVVYVSHPGYYGGPFFRYSVGYPTGLWLAYNMDWGQRRVWVVNRPDRVRYWNDHRGNWHRPAPPPRGGPDPIRRPWTPPPGGVHNPPRPMPPASSLNPIRPGAYTPPRRDDDRNRDGRPDFGRPATQNPGAPRTYPTRPPNADPRPRSDYVKPAPTIPQRSTPWPDRGNGRTGGDRGPRINPAVPPPAPAPQPEPSSSAPSASAPMPAPQNQPQPPATPPQPRDRSEPGYGYRRDR